MKYFIFLFVLFFIFGCSETSNPIKAESDTENTKNLTITSNDTIIKIDTVYIEPIEKVYEGIITSDEFIFEEIPSIDFDNIPDITVLLYKYDYWRNRNFDILENGKIKICCEIQGCKYKVIIRYF